MRAAILALVLLLASPAVAEQRYALVMFDLVGAPCDGEHPDIVWRNDRGRTVYVRGVDRFNWPAGVGSNVRVSGAEGEFYLPGFHMTLGAQPPAGYVDYGSGWFAVQPGEKIIATRWCFGAAQIDETYLNVFFSYAP